VSAAPVQEVDRLDAVGRHRQLQMEPAVLEGLARQIRIGLVVLDQQHPDRSHGGAPPLPGMAGSML
jgi:hypothetical protein